MGELNQLHTGWKYSGGGAQQRVGGQPVGQRGGGGHGMEAARHGAGVHGHIQVPSLAGFVRELPRKWKLNICLLYYLFFKSEVLSFGSLMELSFKSMVKRLATISSARQRKDEIKSCQFRVKLYPSVAV